MNMKKLISSVSALALAASAFAGLAVTANAESPTLTADLEVAGYVNKAYYDFIGANSDLVPAQASNTLSFRDGYGLYNWGSGSRSATITLPEALSTGDILVVDGRATQSYAYSVNINCGSQNSALSTATGYVVFDITSDTSSVTFTAGRATTIRAINVMEKDTSAATAGYTVKYVDESGASVKADETGEGVVGSVVPIDTAAYVAEDGQKYLYVSDDSADNTIAADGSTVVTVTYKTAAAYSYTVAADQGNVIASGSGFEGDTVKVGYPQYINVDGTLYQRGATNKEYNHSFTLDEDNKAVTLAYTATDIKDVVFLAEGEDIDGLTASAANNTKIRSSKSGSAYATADTVITSLSAGKYQVYGVLFSASSGGANLAFTLGDNEFNFVSTENSNWISANSDELTIEDAADLVIKAGGNNNAALDYIYVVKTGDVEPEPAKVKVTVADGDAEPAVTEIEAGAAFTLPEAAGKEGYTFDGWSDGENTVPAGTVVNPEADVTYTAVYTLIPVVVDPTIVVTDGDTYTEDDGNAAKTFTADVTAGTYTITGLTWIAKSGETSKPADEAISVNLSTGTNVVIGLVVEAATVDVSTITADVDPSFAE